MARPDRATYSIQDDRNGGRWHDSREPGPPTRRCPTGPRRGMAAAVAAAREDGRLRITFHGAARQVTGSAHLLEIGRHRILLDCGLFDSDRVDPDSPNRQLHLRPPRPRRGDRLARPQRPHRPPPLPDPRRLQRADLRHPGHRRHPQRDAPRQRPDPARGPPQRPAQGPGRRRADRAPVRAGRRRVGRRALPPRALRRARRDPRRRHADLPRRRPHPRLGDDPARLPRGRPRPPVRLHRRPRPPGHGPAARPHGRQGHRHPGDREHLRRQGAGPLRQADEAAPRDRGAGDPAPAQGRHPRLQPRPHPADGLLPPGTLRRSTRSGRSPSTSTAPWPSASPTSTASTPRPTRPRPAR